MQIKQGTNVDANGKVDLPYLRDWRYVSQMKKIANFILRVQLQLLVQSLLITAKVVSLNPSHGRVY